MHKDLDGTMRTVAEFTGIEVSDKIVQNDKNECARENMFIMLVSMLR